jgi:ParB family chromosome partitioning protein
MSVKEDMAAMTAGLSQAPTVATRRATSALSAPGALMAMNSGYRELQAENDRLKKHHGKPMRVRMDLCDDAPFHTTPVSAERVAELKMNLASNPQSTPALVRLKPDGRFEIIAGRHRKAALAELDHEEWDIVIRDLDDDEAERITFYDNLFAPSISDYAKFRGFESRKKSRGLTIEQLAQESGISKSLVGALLAFAKLSAGALAVIEQHQKLFGANMVAKLAPLVDEHPAEVDKVVELVGAGRLSQDQAPVQVLALSGATPVAAIGKASRTAVVPTGRLSVEWEGRPYATIDVRAKSLTIKLNDKDEAEAAVEAVRKALEARAKKARS